VGPTNPTTVGKMDQIYLVPGQPYAIVVFNNNPGWIAAVNISNLNAPVYSGLPTNIIQSPGGANNGPIIGKISGSYFYAGTNSGHLYIVNISNPVSLVATNLTYHPNASTIGGIDVVGTTVYLTGLNTGNFYIINASIPTSPSVTYSTNVSSNLVGVRVSGNYAYIADYANAGLAVYNISGSPSYVSTLSLSTNPGYIGLHPNGNLLYVTGYSTNVVWIIDINTPGSPSLISTLTPPAGGTFSGTPVSVVFQLPLIFIGNAQGKYNIYDGTLASVPVFIKTVVTGGTSTTSFAVDASYNLYVPNRTNSGYGGSIFQIYSPTLVGDPSAAIQVSSSGTISLKNVILSASVTVGTTIAAGATLLWSFNNIIGIPAVTSGETAVSVIPVTVGLPLSLPSTPWTLSATITNVSLSNIISIVVSYTNDTGSSQTISSPYNVCFVVCYV
jgi:hypothetical protein